MSAQISDQKQDDATQSSRPKEKRTMTVEEAGSLLGISRGAAYSAARSGDLPVIRIGKRILVPKEAFERLFANK